MAASVESLIEGWDGLGVVSRFDQPSGTWIFICLHDSTLGPCTGGTRMARYSDPAAGLRDAMRLAEGMTSKWAAIGLAYGGGKAVLAVDAPLEGEARRGLLLRYAGLVESLSGAFLTGEDLGTSTADFLTIAERTRYVHGFDPEDGAKLDPSPFTARGVFAGLKAALGQVFGNEDPEGRVVLVEGVGNVGTRVARHLAEAGARLLVSDIEPDRARAVAAELGGDVVPQQAARETACDVYAPCAVGAVLDRDTIPRLGCRIVAGAANNQLAESEDADRLHRRGVVYVPDYIINGGGALSFGLLGQGLRDREALLARMDGIGASVREILREAAAAGESPVAAARRRVEERLARARSAKRTGD